MIEKYFEKWDWFNLSINEGIEWNMDLISKFEEKIYFSCKHNHNDNDDWIEYYGYSLYGLSSNKNIIWSKELFIRYEEKWKYSKLIENKNFPFTIEIIEKNKEKIHWELGYYENSVWSVEFIEKYEDKWNWYNLSSNKSLPWSLELIEKYKDKWNWYSGLSSNKNLPWSINLIHKYSDKFESSEYLWNTLKPYINEEMVIELLEEIKNKSNGRNENSRKINN